MAYECGQKVKILPNLFLFQKGLNMMFDGILGKKKRSLSRLRNCYFELVEIFAFYLGGNPYTPHFGQKLENSSELVAYSKRP